MIKVKAVTNLNPEICRRLKEARRAAGLSQSQVAAEVGCKQSALSMFESGDGTKLNDEAIAKLAAKFNIALPESDNAISVAAFHPAPSAVQNSRGFCPNPSCPSHTEYFVDGRRLLKLDRTATDPVGGKFCAICGEVLEKFCPNCHSPVHDGAVCSFCGEPYIAT